MKKLALPLSVLLMGGMVLSACSTGHAGSLPGNSGAASSGAAVSAPPASVSSLPAISESESIEISGLKYYDDIQTIPGHVFAFDEERGGISKNGELWCATPGGGPNHYANPVITDGVFLYTRVIWEDSGDYQWYRIEISDLNATIVVPDSHRKMFIGVEGVYLLCDDGTAFDAKKLAWVTL